MIPNQKSISCSIVGPVYYINWQNLKQCYMFYSLLYRNISVYYINCRGCIQTGSISVDCATMITPLGIMHALLRASLKPLHTIVLWCSKSFRRAFHWFLHDAERRNLILVVFPVWASLSAAPTCVSRWILGNGRDGPFNETIKSNVNIHRETKPSDQM